MLGPNFQEGNRNEFVLNDTDGETIKTIVDFCNTGHLNLTEENVREVSAIAYCVEFDLLEEKCHRFFNDKLSITNSVDMFMMADEYNYKDLRERAFDSICAAFEILPTTDIQKLNHRLLEEVLKCDKIEATEELIVQRLLEWFENSEDDREAHMPNLLKLIRMAHITKKV